MIKLKPDQCALEDFKIECGGDLQGHHIINKSQTRGNAEGRAILSACPPEVMSDLCHAHHMGGYGEAPEARKIMLLQKIYEFGWLHMKAWFDTFLATFKDYRIELELERLLSR